MESQPAHGGACSGVGFASRGPYLVLGVAFGSPLSRRRLQGSVLVGASSCFLAAPSLKYEPCAVGTCASRSPHDDHEKEKQLCEIKSRRRSVFSQQSGSVGWARPRGCFRGACRRGDAWGLGPVGRRRVDADRASLSGLASADKWEAKSANVGSAQGLEVDMRSPAGTETSEVVLEREAPSHEAEEEPASLPEPIPSLRDTKAHAEELLGWVKLDHENAREANTELWRIGMAIIQDADARGVARLHNVSAGLMNRPSFVEVWGDEIAWWSNEDGQPRTLLTAPVKKSLCTGDTEHAG